MNKHSFDSCKNQKRIKSYSGSEAAPLGFLILYPPATNVGTEVLERGPYSTDMFLDAGLPAEKMRLSHIKGIVIHLHASFHHL